MAPLASVPASPLFYKPFFSCLRVSRGFWGLSEEVISRCDFSAALRRWIGRRLRTTSTSPLAPAFASHSRDRCYSVSPPSLSRRWSNMLFARWWSIFSSPRAMALLGRRGRKCGGLCEGLLGGPTLWIWSANGFRSSSQRFRRQSSGCSADLSILRRGFGFWVFHG